MRLCYSPELGRALKPSRQLMWPNAADARLDPRDAPQPVVLPKRNEQLFYHALDGAVPGSSS